MLSDIGGIINPDIIEIARLCKEKNIVLLEECAHSFGATLNGKQAGTFGVAGVYSFYATKAIFAGEGGITITKNDELGNLMKKFVIYDRFEQKMEIGVNFRPSELQALFIYAVVKEYRNIIENKYSTAKLYIDICNKFNPDLIIGSRIRYADYTRSHNFYNKIGNNLITIIFNLRHNTTFTDIYSCYVLYKRNLLNFKELKTNGFEQQAEILKKIVKKGKLFYEVPINYSGRTISEGKKIRWYSIFKVIYQIL